MTPAALKAQLALLKDLDKSNLYQRGEMVDRIPSLIESLEVAVEVLEMSNRVDDPWVEKALAKITALICGGAG